MKKILLTNNSKIFNNQNCQYDLIYTDSPFVVEKYDKAIYLNTLLDKNFVNKVQRIRKEGYAFNEKIIDTFFSNYNGRKIDILDINIDFTNIFICVFKLLKLLDLHPNDQIYIGISHEELYDYENPYALNRFVNLYYLIADLSNLKKINLVCKKLEHTDLSIGHLPIEDWFLKLVDIDLKVLFFNLFKKLKFIKSNKNKIYVYKKSQFIREIEPYLHDLGYTLVDMPEINFQYKLMKKNNINEKLINLLDSFFEKNSFNILLNNILYVIYDKRINYYLQKENYTLNYITKLDKKIKFIITRTINGFDSHIFAKQLQDNNFKIINIMHGLTTAFKRKQDFDFFECLAPDLTLCFNNSEKKIYEELVPNTSIIPISMVQEAKNKRFKFLKRFYVNKKLNLREEKNIFYPSLLYPKNNISNYGLRLKDESAYEFERKIIKVFSKLNKRVIYKPYPMRSYLDKDSIFNFANKLMNIKVISDRYDFRYVSSVGDIFILGSIGLSSTLTWMLGEDKPIIFLYTNKHRFINEEGRKILDRILIMIDIDKEDWDIKLTNTLNEPFENLVKIWDEKKVYRDQYDEEWFLGKNLHCGKIGSYQIRKFIKETSN